MTVSKMRIYSYSVTVAGVEGVVVFNKDDGVPFPLISGNLDHLLTYSHFAAEVAGILGVPVILKSYVEESVLNIITPVECMMMGKNKDQ